MKHIITIERPDDETLTVRVDGEEIATATHDEDGWDGIDLLDGAVRNLARKLGIEVAG